jgi:hypothetical protein
MKIKVFLPNGATEIDNVNTLISLVESGVVEKNNDYRSGLPKLERADDVKPLPRKT